MYFFVGTKEYDSKYSYIIAKNPSNIFEREINNGRKIVGKFIGEHSATGYIENDPLVFLNTARSMNLENYVHAQLSAVCPHNLKGFDVYFRSALRGNNASPAEVTNEEFFKPKAMKAIIGPYSYNYGRIVEIFDSVGICAIVDTVYGSKNPLIAYIESEKKYLDKAFMLSLTTYEPMSITEFLQKIYLISYYATSRLSLIHISGEQIEKFVKMCADWLEKCKYRNSIINTICRRHIGFIEKFEVSLIGKQDIDIEKKQEKLSSFQEYVNKKNLHQKRHELIMRVLGSPYRKTVVDLGSGEGKLLKLIKKTLKDTKVLALEANPNAVERSKKAIKFSKNISIINSNILYPRLRDTSFLLPDFLIATEVIEHLEKEDRDRLIYIIKNLFEPKAFIITAPNYEYNINFKNMLPGSYRHPDHKIEYTEKEFKEEVIDQLSSRYDITFLKILPEEDSQPTFVIYGEHKDPENRNINYKAYNKINDIYQGYYLDISNYTVIPKEISNGFASKQMLINKKNIFYLSPTMAPVEYTSKHHTYLEHPTAAFEYYKKRGVQELVSEKKYMGSAGYVLVFKDPDKAKIAGFDSPIIINSRQGYPFFSEKETLDKIYADIQPKLQDDFAVINCEIMPWSIKAQGLIKKQFQIPGECTYLSRLFGEYGNLKNAKKYLKTLKYFSEEEPLSIRMFQILAHGNYDVDRKRFKDYTFGLTEDKHYNYKYLKNLIGNVFKLVDFHTVQLDSKWGMEYSIDKWKWYCTEGGGEGFVYKPMYAMPYDKNGYLVQPALKVRGKDYLRLIYGIDYLEKEYFKKVKYRSIKRKRMLAIIEHEMSIKMLRAFLHGNKPELLKIVAGFIGMENNHMPKIDATL